MSASIRGHWPVVLVLLVAALWFCPGINWGLPSRAVDPYLFGSRPVWDGQAILNLAPPENEQLGADVDSTPILTRDRVTVVNATDRLRAEIVRRYRLFSHQPDEMITFKSLAHIRQHGGDPRLYQYGGLWVYPVGVGLKLASMAGLIDVRADQAFYLDHPEAFGRFYVVARVYSALWGLVAVWAVYWIVRRVSGGLLVPAVAAMTFAAMPVVVTMAHEAKPHLPGLALALLAVVAATRYSETGRSRWAMLAGAFCGGAFGMVLSGLLSFAVLPMMAWLGRERWRERLLTLLESGIVGGIVYVVTNPFVLINAIGHRELLQSNLGNSTEMYRASVGGVGNAIALIAEGASPVLAAAGVVAGAFLLITAIRRKLRPPRETFCPGEGTAGWLLAAPAAVVLVQFVLLARGKPPEYARFGLLPDTFLLVAAFAAVGRVRLVRVRAAMSVVMLALTLIFGVQYVVAFVTDSSAENSRLAAAAELRAFVEEGARTISIPAEPAPYCMPPVDLFRCELLLAPPGGAVDADMFVALSPDHSLAPISWAGTRFTIGSPYDRQLRQGAPATRPAAPPAVSSRP